MSTEQLRTQLIQEQLSALLACLKMGGESLSIHELRDLAEATAFLVAVDRLEEGLPGEISVVRSVTAIEDALQMLTEETEEAGGDQGV